MDYAFFGGIFSSLASAAFAQDSPTWETDFFVPCGYPEKPALVTTLIASRKMMLHLMKKTRCEAVVRCGMPRLFVPACTLRNR